MLPTCDNRSGPRGAGHTAEGLTRRLDLTERGLAVKATRNCSVPECTRSASQHGLCDMHALRQRRAGDTGEPGPQRPRRYVPGTTCGAPGCPKAVYSLGYCVTHYWRLRSTGSIELAHPQAAPLPHCTWVDGCTNPVHKRGAVACSEHRADASFWARVEVTGACWLWRGALHMGYGCIKVNGRRKRAQVYAYEHLVGPVPAGQELDHLCAVRRCVNPDHLQPVTRSENSRRVNTHQRHSTAIGRRQPMEMTRTTEPIKKAAAHRAPGGNEEE